MPRPPAQYCQVCRRIWDYTANRSKDHVQVPEMGTRDGAAMKRLYTREDGKTYRGMGYIGEAGNVWPDGALETTDTHVQSSTSLVKVICQLNGEVVDTVMGL
jgi:hypothetical protein